MPRDAVNRCNTETAKGAIGDLCQNLDRATVEYANGKEQRMKTILITAVMVLSFATNTHAGWWGATHGVDQDCGAMSLSLLSRVQERCQSGDVDKCDANVKGMEHLINACFKIINQCPNGVSYHFWDNGGWEINCYGG